jgi:probable F420-dependent oxidoreductase
MPLASIGVSLTASLRHGQLDVQALKQDAQRIEQLGYDGIWSGDHIIMYNPMLDVMTVLATYAAVTERVHIGTAVYLVPLRHPIAIAKQITSLDLLSGGRFIFGVGVGGEIKKEFEAVGVPVTERGRRTDEGLDIITRVLSQDHVTYEGKIFNIEDVTLAPRPVQQPHPPIWVGGRSEAAMRRAARYGSCWLGYLNSVSQVRDAMRRIRDTAPAYGREAADIAGGVLMFTAIDKDYESAKQRAIADLSKRYNQPFEKLVERYCVMGTPAQCVEQIQAYMEAGMTHLVFNFTGSQEQMRQQVECGAAEVLPRLRAL